MHALKRWINLVGLLFTDSLVLYFSFYLAYEMRFYFTPFLNFFPVTKGIPPWTIYQQALRIVIPLWIFVFFTWGRLYKRNSSDAANEFLSILKSAIVAAFLMFSATFLYRSYEYSRLVLALSCLLSILLTFLSREVIKLIVGALIRGTLPPETILVLGEGKSAEAVAKILKKDPHKTIQHFPLEALDQVQERVQKDPFLKEVFICGQLINLESLQSLMDICEDKRIEIKILPDLLEMRLGEINVDDSLGIPILHLKPLSLHGFRYCVKRLFDVTVCIFILSFFFFPFLLISFLIFADSQGGIFFRQKRVGFKERRFDCLKFRTMFENAETLLDQWNLNSFRGGPAFKMRGDPRITRVGKFLRKFSLDELPQIWNVLKAEMSLIGPRPQVLKEAAGNPEWAKKRFRILPGITGLWQVSGRADLPYEEMMRLDIYYLESWSPGLDLRILLKTVPVVFGGRGAY
ncbi:MAG: sugar transferase [Elusimicrobia bacterium]|nr:sugar transferase [Elusimicrobiota bacterium]